MKIVLRPFLLAMILALGVAFILGCTEDDDPITDGDVIDGDSSEPDACTQGDTKCVGNDVYECGQQQSWQLQQSCAAMGNYVCLYGVCQKQGEADGDSDADTSDGDMIDGDIVDGDVVDGDGPECIEDGDIVDGDMIDGDVTDSEVDGDATDGDADNDVTDGDVTDVDIEGDADDDATDVDIEVIDGDTDGPEVGGNLSSVNNSDCLSGGEKDAEGVEASWDGSLQAIVAIHRNAVYNCCINKIDVDLGIDGLTLKLYESEDLAEPCDCVCPYDVTATIDGLAPGSYTVEFYKPGSQLAGSAEVIVPLD